MCSTEVFISSFISVYLLNTLFTENTKYLEIKTSIVFNLAFPSNTISSGLFFFFFIIDLYFLIPVVIAQIFNPTVELVKPTGTQTNEANKEIETQPVIAEARISKHST